MRIVRRDTETDWFAGVGNIIHIRQKKDVIKGEITGSCDLVLAWCEAALGRSHARKFPDVERLEWDLDDTVFLLP